MRVSGVNENYSEKDQLLSEILEMKLGHDTENIATATNESRARAEENRQG